MKTVRPPKGARPHGAYRYRFECTNRDCAAVMEVERREVTTNSDSCDQYGWGWIHCPHCEKLIVLSTHELHRARVK